MTSKEMLGKLLVRLTQEGKIIGEIVETEAYVGPNDKASHAYKDKKTKRTLVQFGERGHAYIFRIYGIHCCLCVVVGPNSIPAVTLIRAIEPIDGLNLIRKNRNVGEEVPVHKLTNGPSKVCQALRITEALNGIDLLNGDLLICEGSRSAFEIQQSARVGIDYAEEYKDALWRYYKKNNRFVSRV
jgi:DNA-3-methyladenine glycosylase